MSAAVEEDHRPQASSIASYELSAYEREKSIRTPPTSVRCRPHRSCSTPSQGSHRFDDAESLTSRQSPAPDFFDPNYDTEITWLGKFSFIPPLNHRRPQCHPFGSPEDDSPYPEVRSAVANYDETSMPVATFRAWTLGILWAMILPGINEFYYFRYPSLMVTGVRVPSPLLVPSEHPFRASSAPPPRSSICSHQ